MKIVAAKFLVDTDIFEGMNERIEDVARECYQSSHRIGIGTADTFVASLVKSGHLAMIEHGGLISVKFIVDRGVTHEMVRHRIASFAQESTRYCNYSQDKFEGDVTYVDIIPGMLLDKKVVRLPEDARLMILQIWMDACADAEKHYNRMIAAGASPQIARSVLNNSTKSTITISANPREWLDSLLRLRTEDVAHPQMREVMIPLAQELARLNPAIFSAYSTGILNK